MFTQSGAMTSPLDPSAYVDAAFFESEKAVLRDGWRVVASTHQLARHGDFVSTSIGDVPVLVRNDQGTLRGFVNVCPHRGSLLESPGCGHREALRCQYHGWAFGADGRLAKLPDGASFKGFKAAGVGLTPIPLARLGVLVFARLTEGPPLEAQLGALTPELHAHYERPLQPLLHTEVVFDVNWKVIVDNAVESYHVPIVHPATFERYRAPELHGHLLAPTFTRYLDLEPWSTTPQGVALGLFAKLLLRRRSDQRNTHAHVFPNVLFYYGDLYCDAVVLTPLGPRQTRFTAWTFIPAGLRTRALKPVSWAWGEFIKRTIDRIGGEDRRLWPAVQAGLDTRPTRRATLGIREERITAFQQWLVGAIEASRVKPGSAPTQVG